MVNFKNYKEFSPVINNRDKKTIKSFGKNLLKLRTEKGISQEELTYRTDLSKNMIGNIERGEVNPTLSTISSLAKGLEISIKDLFDF